jgi:hypothetical protein
VFKFFGRNKKYKIIFIESLCKESEKYFCEQCFYRTDKKYKLRRYRKPEGTKCGKGSIGYYKAHDNE